LDYGASGNYLLRALESAAARLVVQKSGYGKLAGAD